MMTGLDPTVPIILFTVMNLEGLEDAARRAGVYAVVSKAQSWDLVKSIRNRSRAIATIDSVTPGGFPSGKSIRATECARTRPDPAFPASKVSC